MNLTIDLGHGIYVFYCHECNDNKDVTDLHKDHDVIRCDMCNTILGYKGDFEQKGILWIWEGYLK
jgi:predicted nucleic acid-binding Zn ribbon protein